MEDQTTFQLRTERLKIRLLQAQDWAFIINLLNSPGWLQYIGDRNVHTEADAISYLLKGPLHSYQNNGFGLWCVELLNTQEPIGICGLIQRPFLEFPDLGFAFLPQFHRQNFAFEASQSCMNYAFKNFPFLKYYAFTLPNNESSIRLLTKLGFAFERSLEYPGTGEIVSLYCCNKN